MSLNAAGSSINAALGAVSNAGAGVPALDVTHSGAAPAPLLADHPDGRAGATTLSKFSETVPVLHPIGVGLGLGVGDAVGVGDGVPVGPGVGVTPQTP